MVNKLPFSENFSQVHVLRMVGKMGTAQLPAASTVIKVTIWLQGKQVMAGNSVAVLVATFANQNAFSCQNNLPSHLEPWGFKSAMLSCCLDVVAENKPFSWTDLQNRAMFSLWHVKQLVRGCLGWMAFLHL